MDLKQLEEPNLENIDEELDHYEINMASFNMKNGCCRECMKAFSKSGKVRYLL